MQFAKGHASTPITVHQVVKGDLQNINNVKINNIL